MGNRQKRVRFSHSPPAALSLRQKDPDGNIILRLPSAHPWTPASLMPWKKKPAKKTLPHLPDEIWQKIFFHAAQDWQKHSLHFHAISYGRLLTLWQGCKCCKLPVGLYVSRLSRDMTMDVIRDSAHPSDGKSHIVVKIIGPLRGLPIGDFGTDAPGEAFYRPRVDDAEDKNESKALTRRHL